MKTKSDLKSSYQNYWNYRNHKNKGCKNPKAISILARGGSQGVVDEVERSIHDALMSVKDVVEYPYIVVGGGAAEAHVASRQIYQKHQQGIL